MRASMVTEVGCIVIKFQISRKILLHVLGANSLVCPEIGEFPLDNPLAKWYKTPVKPCSRNIYQRLSSWWPVLVLPV